MKLQKVTACLASFVLLAGLVACGEQTQQPEEGGVDNVILLETGWVNTPTDDSDPFRAWIRDNYGLNVTLQAASTGDFANAAAIGFSSNQNRPDIVSFPDYTTFRKFYNQDVLIADWTPWLDQMPNIKKMLGQQSQEASRTTFTVDGKLSAIWTPADPPTWSLKLREDWLQQFRLSKGYAADWAPAVPEDLLDFARWIKNNTNEGKSPSDLEYNYGFSSAGEKTSFGTLGTWLPLMYGTVGIAPYGYYVTEDGKDVSFPTIDGTYKKMLDYLQIIIEEELIEPAWFTQTYAERKRTYSGHIGIEWQPGDISTNTQAYYRDHNITDPATGQIMDTSEMWKTYDLPVDPSCAGNGHAGYMPGTGLSGVVITVSKAASVNKSKMEKICKLINDCYCYYDAETDTYQRGVAYDALRWGIGIEEGLEYMPVEGSNQVYCNTSSQTAGNERYYREKFPGAYDWGKWFSSTDDGVIQGNDAEVTSIVLKEAEHDAKTAQMKQKPQIGSYIQLPSAKLNTMVLEMVAFQYKYITEHGGQAEYDAFISRWHGELGGDEFTAEAKRQFRELGLLTD